MSFTVATIAAVGLGAAKGISGFIKNRKAKKEQEKANKELKERMKAYENLDTSNPYAGLKNEMEGMENTFEDLTVNTQQAEFERDAFQQQQANIMGSMEAGGSFNAGNIQALAGAAAQQSRQASASIGAQEAANERLQAAEASKIQAMERQGEIYSRNLQRQKVGTLLGMAQQRTAAYAQQAGAARAQMMSSIASGAKGAATMFAGFGEDKQRPLFGMEGGSDDFNTMMTDIGKTTGDNFDDMDFQGKLNFLKEQYPNMSDEQKSLIPNFILQELDLD